MLNKCFLHPGYIYTDREPSLISTVLGSCVSVCIWDAVQGFGGMNHYIHSRPFSNERSAEFGSISIPYMIKLLMKMGAQSCNFKAHIVGGAQNKDVKSIHIGKQNIEIAERILKEHYIPIITHDTGGEMGRKVVFDTGTGELAVFKVQSLRKYDWYGD